MLRLYEVSVDRNALVRNMDTIRRRVPKKWTQEKGMKSRKVDRKKKGDFFQ